MSGSRCGGSGGRAIRLSAAARGAAGGLALAASPVFAVMALLTAAPGSPAEAFCSGSLQAPGGMATMYLLMSAFHAAPWLKLILGGAHWPARGFFRDRS